MSTSMARDKLARAACRLNAQARGRTGTPMPALILMTDDARAGDPLAAASLLPRGMAVILRHRDACARAELGRELVKITRARGLRLLVSGDEALARRLGAAGMHFPEVRIGAAARFRVRHPSWLVTAAVHSEYGVLRAGLAGIDAALLAPLFPTKSHPEKGCLGLSRFRLIAMRAPIPIYALGGINARNVQGLSGAPLAGIAAIEALSAGYSS